jgi:GNAT superfamily N-acetyltransferase
MSTMREATPADVPVIVQLVRDLAEYEKELDAVELNAARLHESLFGPVPVVFANVVEVDGDVVGFALWFLNYSTWLGRHGIYLEDLYVRPEHRGCGYGKQLLKYLADLCIERNYGRLEWSVLDWNQGSIDFYKSCGAISMDEWTTFRLTGTALTELAMPS